MKQFLDNAPCPTIPRKVPGEQRRAKERAPLLWWKMQPVSPLIAVAFRRLSVVIWRACSVKAISPACGLMLWLHKPDHCDSPPSAPPSASWWPWRRSRGVWVITFKEKTCDCTSISHWGADSQLFSQSGKKLLGAERGWGVRHDACLWSSVPNTEENS